MNLASKPTLDLRGPAPRRGFTLVELVIVMTIIGIIISFILIAARDGVRQSELRATQALILKLESGLNDRLDALMQLRPEPNFSHGYLAGIYPDAALNDTDGLPLMMPRAVLPSGFPDTKVRTTGRAQAIALADYLKSEMPDVFVVNPAALAATPAGATYPLDFASRPFPGTPTDASLGAAANYILPLGHRVRGPRNFITSTGWDATGYGDGNIDSGFFSSSNPQLGLTGRGIYGASYSAASAVYKNLGYLPTGYDMVDNDGNGLIDEWGEGVNASNREDVQARLSSHKHETARSEMLYALLVEGQGPLGSSFNADDFSDREVMDTDGDGLPEFVDAWGKPLQFFRWPVLFHSDAQRGQNIGPDPLDASGGAPPKFIRPYASQWEVREQDPLDPNATLMSSAWWSGGQNAGHPFGTAAGAPTYKSGGVAAFEFFFHRITEPMAFSASSPSAADYWMYWARDGASESGVGYRRAFFSKPLILSGGPDQEPGVFLYPSPTVNDLIYVENNAVQFTPAEASWSTLPPADGGIPATSPESYLNGFPNTLLLLDAGRDDISNHNVTTNVGSGG